jgi:enoyl-CoA hydratase
MPLENLIVERDAAVLVVTLNRPKVLNALNGALLDELSQVIEDARTDDGVRAIVLTGAGVNGFALGGGCELAMACTIRLAADTAKFGQPEINLGLIPGYAGSQRLPRLVGAGRAQELLLTGNPITADEAWRIGLVNRVVPAATLLDEARALANTLAAKPPVAVRYLLDAVARGMEMSLADAQDYEATLFGLVSTTEDMREGTRAFLEKRKPDFKGR